MPLVHTDSRTISVRAFVRNLNILLKFARLYGFEHPRTSVQFQNTWTELRSALPEDYETGLLLAAAGSQLLLDGAPLGSSISERNFAKLLEGAGLASIHFSAAISQEDLARFVKAFPAGGGPTALLGEKLKEALKDVSSIRLNEICFVQADSADANMHIAAQITSQITAQMLGTNITEAKTWFNDPQRLLQLIAAADGSRGNTGGSGGGAVHGETPDKESGIGAGGSGGFGGPRGTVSPGTGRLGGRSVGVESSSKGSWARLKELIGDPGTGTEMFFPQEEDVRGVMQLLRQLTKNKGGENTEDGPAGFQQRLSTMSVSSRFMFREALAAVAAQAPTDRPSEPLLLRLAEHLAIRYAMDSYERGEVRVSAVRQVLDRMAQEVEGLRKILVSHEEKLAEAGVATESYVDQLDRQFWDAVPEASKREILLSPEVWSVPPRNIRQHVAQCLRLEESETAYSILKNYASCVAQEKPEARRKTCMGLCELAEDYGEDATVLTGAIDCLGMQLNNEQDGELRSQVSAALVRLSQEAAARRCYPAMLQTLNRTDIIESKQPAFAQALRSRIGLDGRLPEFINDALREEFVSSGLTDLMRHMPRPAALHLTRRFGRSGFRDECDVLIALTGAVGPEGVGWLRETFSSGTPVEAVETIGLLSRLDTELLEKGLPGRLRECPRSFHDRVVRQLAAGGSPERGRLLSAIFEDLDPLIRPLALDEIGMSGDRTSIPWLLQLVMPKKNAGAPLLCLKAIEALGRLRAIEAAPVLQQIVETKQVWRWAFPDELRLVAAQALAKIVPDWLEAFLPGSGLDSAHLALTALDRDPDALGIRQRRYPRFRLAKPMAAVTTNLRENCHLKIPSLNLGGGVATADHYFPEGTMLAIKINSRLRPVRAEVFVRSARERTITFEIAGISLEDRAQLRRLLVEHGSSSLSGSPKNRVSRRPRSNTKQ